MMGGGGGSGSFSRPTDPGDIRKDLEKAQDETKRSQYEAQVSKMLNDLLTDVNTRDVDGIEKHLDEITSALSEDIDESVTCLFGGSIAKHTYVDGISDVDTLVVLNDTSLEKKSPDEVLQFFAEKLKDRFPKTEISVGRLAVTVKFNDIDIQLLPSLRSGADRLRIPSSEKGKWITINPKAFTDELTSANKKLDGRLVPMIKLAKSIISSLPEAYQLSGYHTESLAVGVFQDYAGDNRPKSLLAHFFASIPAKVVSPMEDTTGQSQEIDSYLGAAGSERRTAVGTVMGRIGRVMKAADDLVSVELWTKILSEIR